MREAAFQAAIMRGLRGHLVRVENSVMSGMPDISGCADGKERWLEIKVDIKDEILLRIQQRAFMELRTRAGGVCFIISYFNSINSIAASPWPVPVVPVNRFNKQYLKVMHPAEHFFIKQKNYLRELEKRIFQ